jgi:hypothetical protein
MSVRIVEKAEFGPLISPQRNQYIPIHNWYTFKHGYSRDLAVNLIANFNLLEGSWVLDPFCGGGTTLLTCRELGINSRGFDILPFSVFLSNVKIEDYDDRELLQQLKILRRDSKVHRYETVLPDIPLVNKAFQPGIKSELLLLKHKIEMIDDPKIRSFFNLGFLGILESVSNTSKTGGFLRIVDRDVSSSDVQNLFFSRVTSMINDVKEYNKATQKKANSLAKIGDARKPPTTRKYDAIITSPPYPNRHDYTRIYSLEMIFDFISNNDELKKIRYETIRSHVEARKKYEATGYKKPIVLDNLITEVRKNGTNNPQVIGMLEGYFEDMYLSLSEICRCLKQKGKVGFVVSNVRFAGVNILVDEILSEIGAQVGLTPKEIWVVRYRGNSSQQMRDYMRKPSRESIIFWEKNAN